MPFCVVKGCTTNTQWKKPDTILHVFPNNLEKIKKWLLHTGQDYGDISAYATKILKGKRNDSFRMCSLHFTTDSYLDTTGKRKILHEDAVPTKLEKDPSTDGEYVPRKRRRTFIKKGTEYCRYCSHPIVGSAATSGTSGSDLRSSGANEDQSRQRSESSMDHMTMSARTEEDQSHMTEMILNLTLEIMYLLTGESLPSVKSDDHLTITVPPAHSLKLESNNDKKIVEAASRIIELLIEDEEWEDVGPQDLDKDDTMETQPPLTSPDGSRNRNPPERCPRPLDSRDSTQEGHTISQEGVNQSNCNVVIKEEIKEEDEEISVMEKLSEEQKQPFKVVMVETSFSSGSHPQNSRDPTPVDRTTHHHDQGEDRIKIKAEVKEEEEETLVSGDQISTEEVGMIVKSETDEISPPTHTAEGDMVRPPLSSAGVKTEDNTVAQNSSGVNPNTQTLYPKPCSSEIPMDPSGHGQSSDQSHTKITNINLKSSTANRSTEPPSPQESTKPSDGGHIAESLYSCLGCGKSFKTNCELRIHLRSHTRVTFTCSECGKSFNKESDFLTHQKIHTGENHFRYSCSECGKCFAQKINLFMHQRIHRGERPFPCSECGKSFTQKAHLLRHHKSHTGDRPDSCSECGKCYTRRGTLVEHQRVDTGERVFLCTDCWKCLIYKGNLLKTPDKS